MIVVGGSVAFMSFVIVLRYNISVGRELPGRAGQRRGAVPAGRRHTRPRAGGAGPRTHSRSEYA